jgi:hypothetical protein
MTRATTRTPRAATREEAAARGVARSISTQRQFVKRTTHHFAGTQIAIIAIALSVPAFSASAASSALDGVVSNTSQESAALVTRGEAAARAGHPSEAWDLFGRAWKTDRSNALAVRWICRLALTFGPAEAATGACREAFLLGRQPEDMRNRVVAWVRGPMAPTMEDFASASFMADGAVRTAPNEPWGYLARGDLALRLGDRELLDASVADLARVASEHPQTKQLLALAAPRASRGVWAGRLSIFFFLALTAADAAWTLRPSRRRWRALVGISAAVVALLLSARVIAAPVTTRGGSTDATSEQLSPPPLPPIDDAHIGASLKKAELVNPLAYGDALMEVVDRAQKATARGDHAAAARFWTAVTQAVPDRSYGYARLCESYEASGLRAQALEACRMAITRDGSTVGDYSHFVRLVLSKTEALSAEDRRQIGIAIAALAKEPQAAADAAELQADLAVRDGDVTALRASVGKLAVLAPESPKTIFYQWTLAFDARDRKTALDLVERARVGGVKPDVVARMEAATRGLPVSRGERAARLGIVGAGAFLLAIALRAAATRLRARVRPEVGAPGSEPRLRKDLGRVI